MKPPLPSLLPLLVNLLLLTACGKGVDSYREQGLGVAGSMSGTLSIPDSGLESGRTYVAYEGSGYYVDFERSNQAAVAYITKLTNHDIAANSIRNLSSTADLYPVHFDGSFTTSPCGFNPSLYCRKVVLEKISAY